MTETINTKLDTILSAVKSNTDNMSIILEKYALQAVTLNSLLSRLDALEKMTSNSITPKRAIKTTLESKPEEEEEVTTSSVAKKTTKGKKVQTTTPEVTTTDTSSTSATIDTNSTSTTKDTSSTSTTKDIPDNTTHVKRVANSVAFFKTIIFQTNYKGLRDTYTSQIEQLIADGKVDKKFDKNKDADKYWLNLGSLVWKTYITSKADKDNMAKLFKEWQASIKTQGVTSTQLEEDEQDE
jgi:hypothetical protein